MCAIVDANVVHQLFGPKCTEAGTKFLDWLDAGSGRLVVGGKLLKELYRGSREFIIWQKTAARYGKIRYEDDGTVNARTDQFRESGLCKSDDPHVIALANVSGARLLYTNDGNLQRDFKNKRLIDDPRGKVYPTSGDGSFQRSHDRLLKNKKLCLR